MLLNVASCCGHSGRVVAAFRPRSGSQAERILCHAGAVDSQNVKDTKLNSAAWSGIVIRARWRSVSPSPGVYDWRFLDQQTAPPRKFGKQYILSIYTGSSATRWLGVPLYKQAPYPWDPTMLSAARGDGGRAGRTIRQRSQFGSRGTERPDPGTGKGRLKCISPMG